MPHNWGHMRGALSLHLYCLQPSQYHDQLLNRGAEAGKRVSRGPARHSEGKSRPGLGVAAGEVLLGPGYSTRTQGRSADFSLISLLEVLP